VLLLLDVANAASRWVSDPWDVGDWLLQAHPALGNASPTQVIDVLGSEGAKTLIQGMAVIAPREHASVDDVDLDPDALRETLREIGAPSIPEGSPADVDLSDFD
jgi:hypothetical protein